MRGGKGLKRLSGSESSGEYRFGPSELAYGKLTRLTLSIVGFNRRLASRLFRGKYELGPMLQATGILAAVPLLLYFRGIDRESASQWFERMLDTMWFKGEELQGMIEAYKSDWPSYFSPLYLAEHWHWTGPAAGIMGLLGLAIALVSLVRRGVLVSNVEAVFMGLIATCAIAAVVPLMLWLVIWVAPFVIALVLVVVALIMIPLLLLFVYISE